MSVRLNPYLIFPGTAREAITHYQAVFGGELSIGTYGDFGASDDPAQQERVMHSQLEADGGLVLMASDAADGAQPPPPGDVSLSGGSEDDATLRGYWEALTDGGTVVEPLVTAPWGDAFGMCTDRHGVTWLVNIAAPAQG